MTAALALISRKIQSLTLVTFGPGALSVCSQSSAKFPQKFRKKSENNPQKSAKFRKHPQNSAKLPQNADPKTNIRKIPHNFRKNPQNPKTLRAQLAKGTPVSL